MSKNCGKLERNRHRHNHSNKHGNLVGLKNKEGNIKERKIDQFIQML